MRTTNKYILFWNGVFSNFYPYDTKTVKTEDVEPLNFELEGIKWKTSEQYFMYKKAIFFGDFETAELIKKAIRPEEAKKLGRKVKNFDDKKWSEVSSQIMYDAVFAKFSQNEELKSYILNKRFDNKHFVEASPFDKIWGIGIHYSDSRCDDESNWLGENKLGKVIDLVRENLKNNKK